ncbi:MAG: hypothetical protein ACK5MT_07390 [Actinomycetales bacterium]
MDSSVIFLALIGLWLVYVVPNRLTRRHHARQTRVHERFTPTARTLQPRSSEPVIGSTRRGLLLHDGVAERIAGDLPDPSAEAQQSPTAATGSTDAGRTIERSPRPRRRPLVGVTFLLSLMALAVLTPFAFAGVIGWTLVTAPLLLAGGCLGVLQGRARRAYALGGSRAAGLIATDGETAAEQGVSESTRPTTVRSSVLASHDEPVGAATMLYDEAAIRAVERAAAVAAARAEAEAAKRQREELLANLKPGEWLPTEVPKPAYLLKPNAPTRPAQPASAGQEPAAVSGASQDDVLDLRDDPLAWVDEHAPQRRRVVS